MNSATHVQRWPESTVRLSVLFLAALAGGCLAAITGLPFLYAVIVLGTLVVFAAIVSGTPTLMMGPALWLLGLFPFSWGIQTGVVPKLFGDEVVLLLYLAAAPLLYIFKKRTWRPSFNNFILVLALFLFAESLSLVLVGHDLIATRNYLETFVLGPLLAIFFVQEAANADSESIATAIVWLTVIIAGLTIIERIVQRNPVMEHVTNITYLSPQLAQLTNGVYRPYVSFFHPSETGAFMALGVPFAIRNAKQKRAGLSAALLVVIAGGLFFNATRGVWVGVAVACLLLMPNALLFLAGVVPAVFLAGTIGYLFLKDTPYMQRLTDANNLFSRFESWKLALRVFGDHPLLGVGHMQFEQVYLSYVQDLSNAAHFDIAKVYVVDNMYLTVLVEHGLVGLLALIGLFAYAIFGMRRMRGRLIAQGRNESASLMRAAELALVIYAITGCFADLDLFTKATKFVFILMALGYAANASGEHSTREIAAPRP